jgi:hypothetical protein
MYRSTTDIPRENGASFAVADDRFPAVFELRRLFHPNFEILSRCSEVNQAIGGFLDHIPAEPEDSPMLSHMS